MCGTEPRTDCCKGRNAMPVLTDVRREEIEQAANLYGSANCWTGTSGSLETMIRELLAEIDRLNNERMATEPVPVHHDLSAPCMQMW